MAKLVRYLADDVPRWRGTLLILGAQSVLRQMQRHPAREQSWLGRLTARSHPHIAAVALANKNARIAWALLAHEPGYQADYRGGVALAVA